MLNTVCLPLATLAAFRSLCIAADWAYCYSSNDDAEYEVYGKSAKLTEPLTDTYSPKQVYKLLMRKICFILASKLAVELD